MNTSSMGAGGEVRLRQFVIARGKFKARSSESRGLEANQERNQILYLGCSLESPVLLES